MYVQSVKALAAKGGYERRVHVDYPLGVFSRKVCRKYAHKACENDEVCFVFVKIRYYLSFKFALSAARLFINADGGNARALRTFEGVCVFSGRDDEGDFTAFDNTPLLRVDKSLQICAATRYKDRDFRAF